jgi:N-acetylglucosaminyldiphosphoundecaprenol N-acetyl-beta-D-mannosaminyltransferase
MSQKSKVRLRTENIAGLEFTKLNIREIDEIVIGWIGQNRRDRQMTKSGRVGSKMIFCVPPHSVELARRDEGFGHAMNRCDIVTPDGIGIVIASFLLGGSIRKRVCGPDLFMSLCTRFRAEEGGVSVFLLGPADQTVKLVRERLSREFPAIKVVGGYAPPFVAEFEGAIVDEIAARVEDSGADVVFIGLGAPKQEKLASKLSSRIKPTVIIPIGGVFDFYSGRIKLPPRALQSLGLIWAYRLFQEPVRLFRRNLDGPIFIMRVVLEGASRCFRRSAD